MSDTGIVIKIEFSDGEIALGGGDETFVALNDGETSFLLNDERIDLVKRLQKARDEWEAA